jgi:hypothetical protein
MRVAPGGDVGVKALEDRIHSGVVRETQKSIPLGMLFFFIVPGGD